MTRPTDFQDVLSRCANVKHTGDGKATTDCPCTGHKHATDHLSLTNVGNKCLAKCHSRHSHDEIAKALGFDSLTYSTNGHNPQRREVAAYDYVDESENLLFQVVRYEPKGFSQRRPDGKDGWIYNTEGVRRVLYRLPEVQAAKATQETVFVVEGEKDADSGHSLGLVCTTAPGGAGKWRDEYSHALRGAIVVLVPDNDAPGEAHAEQAAASLRKHGASVQVIHLPSSAKDLSDFIATGGTREGLERLVQAAKSTSRLTIQTAAELADLVPERPDWRVTGLVAAGALTELDASVKAGKTTLVLHLLRASLSGTDFLGLATSYSPVLFLTEERPATIRAALERVRLIDHTDLHILFRHTTTQLSWPEIVDEATKYAQSLGVGVMVVDTLSRWAGMKGDSENDSGAAAEAVEPLEKPASQGLAVIVLRHDRKGGGELGESARGSTAFTGCADIVLALRRANTEGHPNRRTLLGIGRFDDVPAELTIELQDGEYVCLGDKASVERDDAKARILDYLPSPEDEPCLRATLAEALKPISGSTLSRALSGLEADGSIICHTGLGANKRAKGYTRAVDSINHIGYDPDSSNLQTSLSRDLQMSSTSTRTPESIHSTSPLPLLNDSIQPPPSRCGICDNTDLIEDENGNLVCYRCHTVVREVAHV